MSAPPPSDGIAVVRCGAQHADAALLSSFHRAGVVGEAGAPESVLESVHALQVGVVVLQRFEGWTGWAFRLHTAGAYLVLWGPPLSDAEQALLPMVELEHASTPEALAAAVYRAQGRREALQRPSNLAHALLERAQSAELVAKFAQAIAAQFTMPEIIAVAVSKTRELCSAEGASLLLVDRTTGDLYFDVVAGSGANQLDRIRLKQGQGIAGRVAGEARALLVPDTRQSPDFDQSADEVTGFGTRSVMAVPLVVSGDVLGVLEAVRSDKNPPFTEWDFKRLRDLAPHVAVAVHNAMVTEELRHAQSAVMSANASLERKVEERTDQISRAKKEWERTFDAIRQPIALQEGYMVRRANTAYAERVGLPITQVPGKTCYQLMAGRSSPCPGCPLASGRQGELLAELDFAGGTRYQFSGYWMSDSAEDSRVVVHYQDVTQQRALQSQLRETERLAALGQLASGAAHEINNPIGFVTSNLRSLKSSFERWVPWVQAVSELAKRIQAGELAGVKKVLDGLPELDPEDGTDGLEMLDESLDGVRRVADIVKGLRELSRLEIARREPCDVNGTAVRAARTQLAGMPQDRVIMSLAARQRADIPPLHLDQVLEHLLRNARQAVTEAQRICVRTRDDEGRVVVEVVDQGCGIPSENLRRVFEPFFTTRGVGKGIGLGLTAAYGLVKRSNGDIELESAPGKGTTVRLTLPAVAEPPAPSPPTDVERAAGAESERPQVEAAPAR